MEALFSQSFGWIGGRKCGGKAHGSSMITRQLNREKKNNLPLKNQVTIGDLNLSRALRIRSFLLEGLPALIC